MESPPPSGKSPAAIASASNPGAALRVALLGFGNFERSALVSYLRLSGSRKPAYQQAVSLDEADFVVADADHAGTLDAVLGADRVADTVFIGSLAPDGALAWMMRPIDPLQVFRELDATVSYRLTSAAAASLPVPVLNDAVEIAPAAATVPKAMTAAEAAASKAVPVDRDAGPARRAGDATPPVSALLVDGNDSALRALDRQLQGLGLRTQTASTSQRAIELMAEQAFDLLFLELDLGPLSALDGLALCQQIKRDRNAREVAPRVVVVSAQAAPTDRVRGSFAGCDAYLAKPLDDEALRRGLRKLGVRLAAPDDSGYISRPGVLNSRPMPIDPTA